jgi:methyl-accepting chemotaxis protein
MGETWTFGRKIALGFGIAVGFLLVVSGIGYRTTGQLIENDHRVTHSHAVIEHLSRLLSVLQDTETGQRGYLLAGEDSYLEPFQRAAPEVPQVLEELRALAADNPRALERLERVADLARQKIAWEQQCVDARRSRGLDEALKLVATGVGKQRMDAIRTEVAAMEHEERDLLADRSQAAEASASGTKAATVISTVLALLFVTAAGVIISRSLNQQLGSAVTSIRSASAELQAAATQQAASSREQSSAASEVSTTIRELLSTSRQIAEGAQRVSAIARETENGAHGGDETVRRAQEGIGGIKRQVELVVGHMLELGRKSQQAGGILEIVNELAEQTNILAINATIEAAGAGEGGRRFAVVADEIRKLADRMGASTKEIRGLIDDIRGAVNTTVMATESGTKAVELGTRQFADVTTSFKQIVGLVATTMEAAREIELSTKQQASAVEQVNVAIANVAHATKETEASSTQTLQTATQLAGLSKQIIQLVAQQ